MPVVFIDDKLHENEKILGASGDVVKLWLVSLSWSNDRLTDGYIPKLLALRLVPLRRPEAVIKEIIAAPLWHLSGHPCKSCLALRAEKGVTEPVPNGGYLIHHYFHYQLPAHRVKESREQRSTAGLEGARARWSKRKPDGGSHGGSHSEPHGEPHGGGYGGSHGGRDAVTHAVAMPRTPVPRTPVPGAIAPVPADLEGEPEIPARPTSPRGTAAKAAGGTRGGQKDAPMRHISGALRRVTS